MDINLVEGGSYVPSASIVRCNSPVMAIAVPLPMQLCVMVASTLPLLAVTATIAIMLLQRHWILKANKVTKQCESSQGYIVMPWQPSE